MWKKEPSLWRPNTWWHRKQPGWAGYPPCPWVCTTCEHLGQGKTKAERNLWESCSLFPQIGCSPSYPAQVIDEYSKKISSIVHSRSCANIGKNTSSLLLCERKNHPCGDQTPSDDTESSLAELAIHHVYEWVAHAGREPILAKVKQKYIGSQEPQHWSSSSSIADQSKRRKTHPGVQQMANCNLPQDCHVQTCLPLLLQEWLLQVLNWLRLEVPKSVKDTSTPDWQSEWCTLNSLTVSPEDRFPCLSPLCHGLTWTWNWLSNNRGRIKKEDCPLWRSTPIVETSSQEDY